MLRVSVSIVLLFSWISAFAATIPTESFFRNQDFLSLEISPDGEKLATTLRRGTEEFLIVTSIDGKKIHSTTGYGENHIIRSLAWVNNDRLVMNVSEVVGYLDRSGQWKGVFALNYDGSRKAHLYKPLSSGYVDIVGPLNNDEKHMLVMRHREDGAKLQRMNVYTGDLRYMGGPDEDVSYLVADAQGQPRLAVDFEEQKAPELLVRANDETDWRRIAVPNLDEFSTLEALAMGNNDDAWLLSDYKNGLSSLYRLNLDSGELIPHAQHDFVDISGSLILGANGAPLGLRYMAGKPETAWFDSNTKEVELLTALQNAFPGQTVGITSYAKSGEIAVLAVTGDRNPGEFYLVDTKTMKVSFIARAQSWIDRKSLATMEPIQLKARDGMVLHGYLTKPTNYEKGNRVPMVVVAHGGPHGVRDEWGYNPEVQFLANRGYAVLQINFRGSGGYGRKFLEAGYRKWGREMQDDVTDATLWAVEQGIADREKLCIYGGSYGGYAALQGAVREPDLYKCAIGYVGVYDLTQFMTCGDIPDRASGRRYLERAIGVDDDEHKRYSPSFNVNKIKAAVFLAHGSKDVRVPMCQGEAMKNALEAAGKSLVWMVKPEGHGYQHEENRIEFYTHMESFLAQHIGK